MLCLCADYIDYQNRRPDYIGEFVENLINWKKVICSLCTVYVEQVLGTFLTSQCLYPHGVTSTSGPGWHQPYLGSHICSILGRVRQVSTMLR